MFSSNGVKKLILTSLLLTLVSCITTDTKDILNEKVEPVDDVEPSSLNATEDSKIDAGQTMPTIDHTLIDPMKSLTLPQPLIQGYVQVNNLLTQNKNQTAIALLEKLQNSHPKFSGPSYRLARIYQIQKDQTMALQAINNAIDINPENYYAFNLKGLILRENGDFKGAKTAYLAAIEIYPNYLKSELNLAILADMYLYEHNLALFHYQRYMLLLNQLEASSEANSQALKKVSGWIADLKRRMPREI